jgi:hypothetical protein
MATTTPNFGWAVPTSSDLVKNGATAIETLGDSIDASLVDLKGGTTGQVLAKATSTDMDFTWVAQDDSNAIQNAIVDAKGDLIGATAADTPARLAVGTNYGFLQADSAQATGLLWNNAAWTTYTPTITATSGTFTTVSATGRYTRLGKLCVTQFAVTITTNGTAAGQIVITAPFGSGGGGTIYQGTTRESNATGFLGSCAISSGGGASFYVSAYDNSYMGGSGRLISGSISYEVA